MDASTELEQLYLSVRLAQFAASACSGSGWRALFSSAVSRGHASPLVFVPRPRRRRRGSARRTKSALQPSKDRRSRKLAWRSSRASAQVCRSRCFRYFIASGHFGLGLPTNCRDGVRRVLLHPGRSNCAIALGRQVISDGNSKLVDLTEKLEAEIDRNQFLEDACTKLIEQLKEQQSLGAGVGLPAE